MFPRLVIIQDTTDSDGSILATTSLPISRGLGLWSRILAIVFLLAQGWGLRGSDGGHRLRQAKKLD